jgi:hypothetical protein
MIIETESVCTLGTARSVVTALARMRIVEFH